MKTSTYSIEPFFSFHSMDFWNHTPPPFFFAHDTKERVPVKWAVLYTPCTRSAHTQSIQWRSNFERASEEGFRFGLPL